VCLKRWRAAYVSKWNVQQGNREIGGMLEEIYLPVPYFLPIVKNHHHTRNLQGACDLDNSKNMQRETHSMANSVALSIWDVIAILSTHKSRSSITWRRIASRA
jgi:hypothetical protein